MVLYFSEEDTPPISVAPLLPPPPLNTVSDPIVHDHLSSSMSSNSPEEGDIGITPGQEQAIQELQDMKNDMGYTSKCELHYNDMYTF